MPINRIFRALSNNQEIVLRTDRLILRPFWESDYAIWAKIREKNRNFVQPWDPLWAEDALTKAFFLNLVRQHRRSWKEGKGYHFLCLHKDTEELVGGVNVNNIVHGVSCQGWLGYWMSEKFTRQGYGVEALSCVINYAFHEDNALHRLNAATLQHNEASQALLLKLGFQKEGVARKFLKINGQWQDHALYALLCDDKIHARKPHKDMAYIRGNA